MAYYRVRLKYAPHSPARYRRPENRSFEENVEKKVLHAKLLEWVNGNGFEGLARDCWEDLSSLPAKFHSQFIPHSLEGIPSCDIDAEPLIAVDHSDTYVAFRIEIRRGIADWCFGFRDKGVGPYVAAALPKGMSANPEGALNSYRFHIIRGDTGWPEAILDPGKYATFGWLNWMLKGLEDHPLTMLMGCKDQPWRGTAIQLKEMMEEFLMDTEISIRHGGK